MASSYDNELRLNEMATGDASGTWGTTTNVNLNLIGEALGYGTEGITTNADTHISTIADGATDPVRAMYVEYTGTLDSACTITIAPNTVNRMQFIENGTSGSQNIIIKQGSGATITIPPGDVKAVYLDGAGSGAAVVDAFASLNVVDLKVQDDLTVTDDATIGGTLGVTGIVTLTDDLIIGDGKTIGSASDVDAMTIAANGQITLTQTLIGTALDISGDIDVDGTTNLDNTDIDGTLDVSGQATFADGSAGAPSISNTGDVNAGLFFSAADVMSFSAGGTAQFTMADGSISPVTDNDIDLGTASLKYKSFFAGLVDSENFKVNGGQGDDGQVLTSTGSGVAWEAAGGGPTFKTFGTGSIMVGDDATGTIDAADNNTGLGVDVFAALTSGDGNTAVGGIALDAITTSSDNTAVGHQSLTNATSGVGNTALGKGTMTGVVTGSNNVAVGRYALSANTSASNNVAVGINALVANTTGAGNTAVGAETLAANTEASNNTGVGLQALDAATTGGANTAVGKDALGDLTTGSENTAVGWTAAGDLTTARFCTAVGRQALRLNTTTENLTAVGYTAMRSTTGASNTAVGNAALYTNAGGVGNTACGDNALYSNSAGNRNTAIGFRAGHGYTGSENIFIGNEAGEGASAGNFNTFVGHQAGEATNGSSNIILGNATSIGAVSNRYVIGNANNGTGTADDEIAFVKGSTFSRIALGGTSITASSDERMKKDIADHSLGLSFINRLRPVNFKWKAPSEFPESFTSYDSEKTVATKTDWQTGLIAQEVKAAMDAEGIETAKFDVWNEEEDGSQALSPAQLIMPLVKALQEADDKINALTARIETLEG